jgi:hypothetical protein
VFFDAHTLEIFDLDLLHMNSTITGKMNGKPIVLGKSLCPTGVEMSNLSSKKKPASSGSRTSTGNEDPNTNRVSEVKILKATDSFWGSEQQDGKRLNCNEIFKMLVEKFSLKSGLLDEEKQAVVDRIDHLTRCLKEGNEPERLLAEKKLRRETLKWFNDATIDTRTRWTVAIEYLEIEKNCFLSHRMRNILTVYVVQLNFENQGAVRNASLPTNKRAADQMDENMDVTPNRPTKRHQEDSNESADEWNRVDVIDHVKTLVEGFGVMNGNRDVTILSRCQRVREIQNMVSLHKVHLAHLKKIAMAEESSLKKLMSLVERLERENDHDSKSTETLIPMATSIHSMAEQYIRRPDGLTGTMRSDDVHCQILKKITDLNVKLISSCPTTEDG